MAKHTGKRRIKKPLVQALAFVLLLALICGLLALCHRSEPAQETPDTATTVSREDMVSAQLEEKYQSVSDHYKLYMQQLESIYPKEENILRILLHIESYPDSLLDVLLIKTELLPFVAAYPDCVQSGLDGYGSIDISADYTPGEFPLFLQWDSRWGYEIYGSDVMALTACGPTCFAMAYVGLTGDTTMNPMKAAKFAIDNGYYSYGNGTYNDLFISGASAFGMVGRSLTRSILSITDALEAGHVVVACMAPGDFTTQGHYILLTGLNPDGTVNINDPNSKINSSRTWALETVVPQIKYCNELYARR